jgi:hypothetical protein
MQNHQADIIRRFHTALPQVRGWIDGYLAEHAAGARTVSSFGYKRLATCFPRELLDQAKVASVERPRFPPVDTFGLPEFAQMQQQAFNGITFKNTFFVQRGRESESLYFHELVHVIQWARLGVDRFLLAYGLGLVQLGYERSPLEDMAYGLQRKFDVGVALPNPLVDLIERATDGVWNHAREYLQVTSPR